MSDLGEVLLIFIKQFAGGPGPPENNLMRFALPALLWGSLLFIAWRRQRVQHRPRERLLIWGFALGLTRELIMFVLVVIRLLGYKEITIQTWVIQPLEHGLAMAAIIVISAAFLRYALDDNDLSMRYLGLGLAVTAACFVAASITWSRYFTSAPGTQFHQTPVAWFFHAPLSIFIIVAIFLLRRSWNWLSKVVIAALSLFLASEILILVNNATEGAHGSVYCPIGNSLRILAIPLLAFVYLREQAVEKGNAENALAAYRHKLEDLVKERTADLSAVNQRLKLEISERKQAEVAIAQRTARLAAQYAVAATLSQSLDLDTLLNSALETILNVLEMEVGVVFLANRETHALEVQTFRGNMTECDLFESILDHCYCVKISEQAMKRRHEQAVLWTDIPPERRSCFLDGQQIRTLVSVPLVSKGKALGALTLGSQRESAMPQPEIELLTSIGQQIGMAVENARLYHEAEHWATKLSMLNHSSMVLTSTLDSSSIEEEIAQQAPALLSCDTACVVHWEQELQTLEIISNRGLSDAEKDILINSDDSHLLFDNIWEPGTTLAIASAQTDPAVPVDWKEQLSVQSLLCLPIWGPEVPEAFLLMLECHTSRHWRADELELIESFVSSAAVALENAKLHKQLEWAVTLEERHRIATNMHDGLAQTLSLLGLKVDHVAENISDNQNGSTLKDLQHIRLTVDQASEEVRGSISSLREPPRPRCSLQELLTEMLGQQHTSTQTTFDLVTMLTEPIYLQREQEVHVLPLVKEAVLNACKHAHAQNIRIVLRKAGDQIQLNVEDDGRGFDPQIASVASNRHFGLSIMRARAKQIGGSLQIESTPGAGTSVMLLWRLDGKQGQVKPSPLSQPQAEAAMQLTGIG